METTNQTTIFPEGQQLTGAWFTGNAFLFPLIAKDHNNEFSAGAVTFYPAARTHIPYYRSGNFEAVTSGIIIT